MAEILEAGLFGLTVLAFVLGLSSIIMGFIETPADEADVMKVRIEYGFFGVIGLVATLVLAYGLM